MITVMVVMKMMVVAMVIVTMMVVMIIVILVMLLMMVVMVVVIMVVVVMVAVMMILVMLMMVVMTVLMKVIKLPNQTFVIKCISAPGKLYSGYISKVLVLLPSQCSSFRTCRVNATLSVTILLAAKHLSGN